MNKKTLKIVICTAVLLIPISAFASDYSLDALGNSEEEIVYKSSNDDDFDNEMKVFVEIPSTYEIIIPKKLVISGVTKKANYYIKVNGNLSDSAVVNVVPEDTIEFASAKTIKYGTVTQDKTKWTVDDLDKDATGEIDVSNLTAGRWEGSLYFDISFEGNFNNGIDGKTAEPNDIQTWLKCANINKDYYGIGEVLGDLEVLEKLMNNENASDYLVRSTNWIDDICDDGDAMECIGNNNYTSNLLLDDENWLIKIANSKYYKFVLNVEVPKMTSNTSPKGEVSASDYHSDATGAYAPWMAFNDTSGTYMWHSNVSGQPTDKWIEYKFVDSVKILACKYTGVYYSTVGARIQEFKILGSNNRSDFTDLGTFACLTNSTSVAVGRSNCYYTPTQTFILDNEDEYNYYRLRVTKGATVNGYYPMISYLNFLGRKDV